MNINNSVMNALNSTNLLKQAVGIAMFNNVKDQQNTQMNTMLQDFSNVQKKISPHPSLGSKLDIRV